MSSKFYCFLKNILSLLESYLPDLIGAKCLVNIPWVVMLSEPSLLKDCPDISVFGEVAEIRQRNNDYFFFF